MPMPSLIVTPPPRTYSRGGSVLVSGDPPVSQVCRWLIEGFRPAIAAAWTESSPSAHMLRATKSVASHPSIQPLPCNQPCRGRHAARQVPVPSLGSLRAKDGGIMQ